MELVIFAFAKWSKQIPGEITVSFSFMNVPDVPAVPEILRGRPVVVIKGCYCGEDTQRGEQLFAPVRTLFKPIADTFATLPVNLMDTISKDPVDPTGSLQYGGMIADLSTQAIKAFVNTAGAGSGSSLLFIEIRKLGAALTQENGAMNLMGNHDAQFSVAAVGGAVTDAMAEKSKIDLSRLSETLSPYLTGEVFCNFIEVDPTTPRVRAAYTLDDWQRLTMLKRKYDPQNIFRFKGIYHHIRDKSC